MRISSVAVTLLVIVAVGLSFFIKPPREELPILGTAPAFVLEDSRGGQFSSEVLKGKVWVASFIFTSCQATCPTLMGKLSKLSQTYQTDARVRIVSISVDPQFDTPEVLSKFAERYDADNMRWHLLTGAKDTVTTLVVEGFKVGSAAEPLLHSNRFYLIDEEGRIRGTYLGTEADDVAVLKQDLQKLLA